MTAGRNEFIRRIVGAGKGTVREHITVKIIAYGVAVERDQAVIRVILEAAVGGRGYVACCIVVKGLCRNDRVITELLDSPCSNSAEAIISITHLGRICKYLDEKQPHPKVRLNIVYKCFSRYSLYESFNEKYKKNNEDENNRNTENSN